MSRHLSQGAPPEKIEQDETRVRDSLVRGFNYYTVFSVNAKFCNSQDLDPFPGSRPVQV